MAFWLNCSSRNNHMKKIPVLKRIPGSDLLDLSTPLCITGTVHVYRQGSRTDVFSGCNPDLTMLDIERMAAKNHGDWRVYFGYSTPPGLLYQRQGNSRWVLVREEWE